MVRLALSYSSGAKQRFQFLAQGLPACILVTAGERIGENRQGDRPETGETAERLLLLRRGGAFFFLDLLQGADGGDDVAGLRLFTAGDDRHLRLTGQYRLTNRDQWRWHVELQAELGAHHGEVSFSWLPAPPSGPDGAAGDSAPSRGSARAATVPAETWGRPSGGTEFPLARPGGLSTAPSLKAPGGVGAAGEGSPEREPGSRRSLRCRGGGVEESRPVA